MRAASGGSTAPAVLASLARWALSWIAVEARKTAAEPTTVKRQKGWVRRHWRILVAVVVVLVVGLRITLPYIIRSQIASRGTAAIQGRVALGDVDLSLLRG